MHWGRVPGDLDWHPICVGLALTQEAALEKARAGEGRNVEHVALETKGTLELAAVQSTAGQKYIGPAPQPVEPILRLCLDYALMGACVRKRCTCAKQLF